MKNTKLIALVAVLVVVSLVVSIAVALGNDKKGNDAIVDTIKNYEQQIAELNKTIEDLEKGLISSTEALEKLQAAGVEIKNWNEATAVLTEKIAELDKAQDEFIESVNVYDEKDEKKENPLVTYTDLYVFSYTQGEETVWHDDQFVEIYYNAYMDLYRATSVAEMNTIIANFKADLAKVPTILDMYIANLETVEKDGKVTYDEYDTIKLARELALQITNDHVFAPAAEGEKKGQKELLQERYDALMAEFKPLAVKKFVELAGVLPTVEQLAPSHEEALDAAKAELAFVGELYEGDISGLMLTKKGKATEFGKAYAELTALTAQWTNVEYVAKFAEQVNGFLKNAFTEDRKLQSYDVEKYGANIETYNYINKTLMGYITWWYDLCAANNVVVDEEDEDFNAEIYNLIDYTVYEGYVADFEAEVATLRAAADEFIAAVEAIENVNLDSKATLDAAKVLFDKVSKGQKIADLDTILDLNDYVDDEGEDVEVTGVADSYDAWLTQYARFNWLVDAKKDLEDSVKNALIKCTADHGTDKDGNKLPCDGKGACELVGTYNLALIGNFDDDILAIIAMYELDETVYDAELLSVYKLARIQTTLNGVLTLVDNAYAASTNTKKDTLKAILVEEIKAAAADYTFEAEFTCEYPDVKDHECNCAEKLANWALVIENDATALVEKYTAEILADRFN